MTTPTGGFVPPPYPYDRLGEVSAIAGRWPGGAIDLSVGTPVDPPPPAVVAALADPGPARGYPPSIGTADLRASFARWAERRLGVVVDPAEQVAACIGTKEFVAGAPHWLRLRDPARDTVLYPEVSYPTYAMGATLAGCRAVPVPVRADWTLDLDAVADADAERAVCLWLNTPANPTGALDDLVEFTWQGGPRTVLEAGTDGVLAVHSMSKRSNLAGARVGAYAGDAELVGYLKRVRQHAGFMVPGPVQAAAVAAWDDDSHVDAQRHRYADRLARLQVVLAAVGIDAPLPDGAFYLWAPAPDGDAWSAAAMLAERLGVVVSPGEFYGPASAGWFRVAAVVDEDRLAELESRLGG